MKLYVIVSHITHKPIRYGLMGDNKTIGYCLYRGHIVAFDSYSEAKNTVEKISNLALENGYHISEFNFNSIGPSSYC